MPSFDKITTYKRDIQGTSRKSNNVTHCLSYQWFKKYPKNTEPQQQTYKPSQPLQSSCNVLCKPYFICLQSRVGFSICDKLPARPHLNAATFNHQLNLIFTF